MAAGLPRGGGAGHCQPAAFRLVVVVAPGGLDRVQRHADRLLVLPGSLNPYLIGKIVDQGIVAQDWSATWRWAFVMLVVVLFGVASNVVSLTVGVTSWLISMFRVTKLVVRKVGQMSHVVTRRVPAGEILQHSALAKAVADRCGRPGRLSMR